MTFLSTALLSVAHKEIWVKKPFTGIPSVVSGTTYVSSVTDGPMVIRYDSGLTIDENSLLTPANRCKGMAIFVKGDLIVNGTISMSARGSAGIGDNLAIDYKNAEILINPANFGNHQYEISAAGGDGGVARNASAPRTSAWVVRTGSIGSLSSNYSCGGGGSGGVCVSFSGNGTSGAGGRGTSYSGGSGGGGVAVSGATRTAGSGSLNSGSGGAGVALNSGAATSYRYLAGGGSGNPGGAGDYDKGSSGTASPGGTGAGGLLIIVVKGNIIINQSGIIQSNGMNGGSCTGGYEKAGGGGSGGGSITILYTGTYTNKGTIQANGGVGGTAPSGGPGGAGAAGSIRISKITL